MSPRHRSPLFLLPGVIIIFHVTSCLPQTTAKNRVNLDEPDALKHLDHLKKVINESCVVVAVDEIRLVANPDILQNGTLPIGTLSNETLPNGTFANGTLPFINETIRIHKDPCDIPRIRMFMHCNTETSKCQCYRNWNGAKVPYDNVSVN